ncbi:excinuclease ABC subunit UvrC [Arcanobacterium bovis]|uniref:UvrABC system protein C n=1 Tax=Arcanobacterium bovis TaxID=2529275 RepID=A0A4Q9V1I8_9ACTO|nr:excinuclease ABC subunit UvrC [Arcanobacterium bovis]TBW22951.1 excinuclease ABC subunit UvrC [Arcanobacterium bovis]
MADPQSYRPRTQDIPENPGVYRFIDDDGRVIYVGKAKNLRKRLVSYFRDPIVLHPRTRQMVFTAVRVVWVVVQSELEALTLEYAWIKEYDPRFNVMYRDDKSYPYLAITVSEEYPRLMVTRDSRRKGIRYYGPYTQTWAVRESLDLLLRVFPVRSCTKGVFNNAHRAGRPCLNGYIDRCSAPCIGRISAAEHRELISAVVKFLDGTGDDLIKLKSSQMKEAAQCLDFELAAKLRDQVQALQTISEKNTVVLDSDVDADVFGLEFDEIEASVQVFYVRGGRIRGQRGWVSETAGVDADELLSDLLLQVYGAYAPTSNPRIKEDAKSVDDVAHTATTAIPREIWLPQIPAEWQTLSDWLSSLRGANVHIKNPQKGLKANLMRTVHLNAVQALQRHKLHRSGDITERSQALEELRVGLNLERAPLRIECYDVSHTQGTHQVASMVVFEDGLAKKQDYRHFIVRGPDGHGTRDDTAAMDEVLRRRLLRLASGADANDASDDEPLSGPDSEDIQRPRKFAYRPDLIVVDGGLPQVNAAQRVVDELNADVTVIGLAKRLEEVWIPGQDFPLILPRTSPALRLLQYLRDESHRFAITFHRKKRSKAMTRSILDDIPGLGPSRQKALLKHFGSVARIRQASLTELCEVPGIGSAFAQTIHDALRPDSDADSPVSK